MYYIILKEKDTYIIKKDILYYNGYNNAIEVTKANTLNNILIEMDKLESSYRIIKDKLHHTYYTINVVNNGIVENIDQYTKASYGEMEYNYKIRY